jgi:hypothetical protein
MSSSIWTQCGGRSSFRSLRLEPFRVVEAQHINSTRKLVDSDEEQELLESLIDGAKRPAPVGKAFAGLHYLLSTPFRYPPLRYGSRFGSRGERGIWYGSRTTFTALAETAYYRLLFLEGTLAELGPVSTSHSVLQAAVSTRRGVDLTRPPLSEFADRLASPTSYADTQPLGAAMREDGAELFLFTSARDPARGDNVGLFEPCFSKPTPTSIASWICTATREAVEMKKSDLVARERHRFPRATFEIEGQLPAPGAVG